MEKRYILEKESGRPRFAGSVHSSVNCVDNPAEIVNGNFLCAPKKNCKIPEDAEIEILDGPVPTVDMLGDSFEVVRVRYLKEDGKILNGWIPFSFIK